MNPHIATPREVPSRGYARALLAAMLLAMLAACVTFPDQRKAAAPGPAPAAVAGTAATAGATAPAPAAAAPAAAATPPAPPLPAQPASQPPTQPIPAAIDKTAVLRTWVNQQDRLYRVAGPLLINGNELCPQHARNLLGFTAKNRYSYTEGFVDTASSALGLGERLQVMNVLPGSGAEMAGLRKGDALFAVEIEPLPQGPNAEKTSASIIGTELRGRNSVSLTVLRGEERIVHNITLTPACAMVIDLGNAEVAGSFSDGQRVMVTRGLLETAPSDDELAYVLAREIAHNILAPHPRPDQAAIIDRLHTLTPPTGDAALAAAASPILPEQELQARKLALYLLARAGYAIDNAPGFWQKIAIPPASPESPEVLAQTMGAIAAKKQLGAPLMPEQP